MKTADRPAMQMYREPPPTTRAAMTSRQHHQQQRLRERPWFSDSLGESSSFNRPPPPPATVTVNKESPLYRPKLSSHSYREAVGGSLINKYSKYRGKGKVVDMTEQSNVPKAVSVFKLFSYATCLDWFLMLLGTVGAILHGVAFPVGMNIFGDIANAFVNHDASRGIVQQSTVPCPGFNATSLTRNSLLISDFSALVGGNESVVNCAGNFTFVDPFTPGATCAEFTLEEVLQSTVSAQTTCLDNNLFIDEVNNQIFIFLGIAFGALLVAIVQVWFFQTAAERQIHRIRLRYYKSILRQDIAWFDTNPTGEVASRLSNDLEKIYKGIGDNLALLIQWTSTFFAAIGVGLFRDWRLALVLLGVTPLLALSGGMFAKLGGIFSSREQKFYASAGAVAEEVLSSIHTIFMFGGEQRESKRYDSHLAAAGKQGAWKGLAVGLSISSIYFLDFFIYAISFWFGAYLVQEELAQAGDVLTVFFAILIGAFVIGQAGPNLQKLVQAQAAAGAVYQVIDRTPPIDSGSEGGKKLEKLVPTVEFKNVGFSYPTRQNVQILKGLDLTVSTGQTVGIVGASGSGKSTVVELIQRFYDPTDGEVLVGGVNIKELNLKWLRSHIGVVSQEPVLFDTTIAENIRYGKEDATMEDIEEAAKQANAHDFIASLPDGYESLVGEGGELLSGGQKQRITIARALLRNPSILLLDEATSSLDSQSERIVQNALDAACQGRTTIVIAHRLSTIQNADMIVAIADGRVAEMGTHSELMAQQGIYHDLVKAQSIADQIPREAVGNNMKRKGTGSARLRRSKRRSSRRQSLRSFTRTVRKATISLSPGSVIGQRPSSVSVGFSPSRKRGAGRTLSSESQSFSNPEIIEMEPADRGKNKGGEETTAAAAGGDGGTPAINQLNTSKLSDRSEPTPASSVEVQPRAARYAELIDDEDEEANLPDVSVRDIFKFNKSMWGVILVGCLAALVAGTVWPALAIVFGEVLNVFSGPSSEVLAGTHPWGATYLALGVVAAIAVLVKNVTFTISGENLTSRMRSLLFKSMLRQDIGWFDDLRNNTAALTNRLSYDTSEVQGAAGIRLGTLIESLTGLVAAVAVGFAYSWIMAIVILGFMPIIAASSSLHFTLSAGSTKRTNKAIRESTEIAIESIENIRTVASFSLEDRFHREFLKEVAAPYHWSVFYAFIYGVTYGISQSIILFVYIISFRFGAFLVTFPQGHVLYTEFQDIFRVFAAIIFSSLGIGAAASFAPDYNQAKRSAKIVFSIINREPAIDNYSEEGTKPDKANGEVMVNDIFFAYPERDSVNVLSGLNLSVKPGKTLAIVGSSGSGKSTVFALIERFYDAHSGCILLDGVDLRDLNLRWLREQIGFVAQDPDLLEGSIAENIRYGALFREVSDEEVIEAAKSANIHSFIESLPQGYSTEVGAKGNQLSGGQKQRVAIARALIRDPKILLLDEATSALDTESEKVVQEALDKAREGRTSIVIAHRLSTIYNADQIAVMRRGKVVEQGTHAGLLAKKGIYYNLNSLQLHSLNEKVEIQEVEETVEEKVKSSRSSPPVTKL